MEALNRERPGAADVNRRELPHLEGRKRPIRIVTSHPAPQPASLTQATRNRMSRVPVGWRITVGIIVLLSVLEGFLTAHSPSTATGQQTTNAVVPGSNSIQDPQVSSPHMIVPAG
jgi:hypothetical protein